MKNAEAVDLTSSASSSCKRKEGFVASEQNTLPKQTFVVTTRWVIEAYIMCLDNHLTHPDERPLRLLTDEDITAIFALRKDLAWLWRKEPKPRPDYRSWRGKILDQYQVTENWSRETRNLYASILSVLTNWQRHGQGPDTIKRLETLEPGARLFLQFLKNYQPKLI